uniref:hypothetical protein n=1 Tax=Priestia flexa TaxID=86664 RepID=UPI002493A3BE
KGYSEKMDDYYLCSRVFIFLLKRKNNKTENSVNIYATLVPIAISLVIIAIEKLIFEQKSFIIYLISSVLLFGSGITFI